MIAVIVIIIIMLIIIMTTSMINTSIVIIMISSIITAYISAYGLSRSTVTQSVIEAKHGKTDTLVDQTYNVARMEPPNWSHKLICGGFYTACCAESGYDSSPGPSWAWLGCSGDRFGHPLGRLGFSWPVAGHSDAT